MIYYNLCKKFPNFKGQTQDSFKKVGSYAKKEYEIEIFQGWYDFKAY